MEDIYIKYILEQPKRRLDPDALNLTIHAYDGCCRVATIEAVIYNMLGEDVCKEFANVPWNIREQLLSHYTRDIESDEYNVCYLEYLRVNKTCRGKGVGSKMMLGLHNFLAANDLAQYIILQPCPLDRQERKDTMTKVEQDNAYSNRLAEYYRKFGYKTIRAHHIMQLKVKKVKKVKKV